MNDLISTRPGSRDGVFVLTKILHILVGYQSDWALWCLSTLRTGTVSLKDDNAVRRCRGHESGPVAELSPAAVVLEEDVAEAIAECSQEESDMSDEPCELERLGELHEALLERFALRSGRWWCHVGAVSRAQWGGDWRSWVACDSFQRDANCCKSTSIRKRGRCKDWRGVRRYRLVASQLFEKPGRTAVTLGVRSGARA